MSSLITVLAHYFSIGTIIGCIPLALLFVDYRRKRDIRKPLIYLAVFFSTIAVLLPVLLKSVGLWLALIAPVTVMCYAFLARAGDDRR